MHIKYKALAPALEAGMEKKRKISDRQIKAAKKGPNFLSDRME